MVWARAAQSSTRLSARWQQCRGPGRSARCGELGGSADGGDDPRLGGRLAEAEARERSLADLELQQREQEVLGAHVVVAKPESLLEGEFQRLLGLGVVRDQGRRRLAGRGRQRGGYGFADAV